MAKIINKEEFDRDVMTADVAFVDFFADWCPPCKMMAPIVEELAEEYQGKALVVKVNVDNENELANRYQITAIPTMIVFKKGQVFDVQLGAVPKSYVKGMIDKAL